jgi:hypothetical protein
MVHRNPEQTRLVLICSIWHPQGFTPNWTHPLALEGGQLWDEVHDMFCRLSANQTVELEARLARVSAGMGGAFTGTHQRIAPANHWLLERKLAIKADPSLFNGDAISWWLDNQDIAPEATCLVLYFLCRSNSTADEERRFCNVRRLLSLYRHRLRPRTLELLLLMQRERDLTERVHFPPEAYRLSQDFRGFV